VTCQLPVDAIDLGVLALGEQTTLTIPARITTPR
jgi:hypothetical protein